MRKFQCLLFVLKRSCICYYIICMTVPLSWIWMKKTYLSYMSKNLTFYCKKDSHAPVHENRVALSKIRFLNFMVLIYTSLKTSSFLAKVSFRYVHRHTSNKSLVFLRTKLFIPLTFIKQCCFKQVSV